ncbi:hypothetical protein LCGC14_2323450 [marine sediment metagenome]|uniref:Uncharacterized protein n=1 Tax=marine sediment metagenome TaxID=412755 RepID=A0A0F9EUI6_9ZZZZ
MTFNVTNTAGTNYTLGTMVNSTPNQSAWATTLTVPATIADATGYNITCHADNATDEQGAANHANDVTIDGTNPDCFLTGDHKTIPWKGIIEITWVSSDAVQLTSTAVTIDGPQDQTTASYTDTNRSVTLGSQDTPYIGDWTVSITGTDRSANTCTDTYTFKSYLPDGEIWEAGEPAAPKDTGKILLLLGIVGVVVYFAFIKKR